VTQIGCMPMLGIMNGWCYLVRILPSYPSKIIKVIFRSTKMILSILELDKNMYNHLYSLHHQGMYWNSRRMRFCMNSKLYRIIVG
jgi:hypothetical protein